jgi:hypothetical protein
MKIRKKSKTRKQKRKTRRKRKAMIRRKRETKVKAIPILQLSFCRQEAPGPMIQLMLPSWLQIGPLQPLDQRFTR